jgi:hypothetical protein
VSRRLCLGSNCARHKYQKYEALVLETEPGVLSNFANEEKLAGHLLLP